MNVLVALLLCASLFVPSNGLLLTARPTSIQTRSLTKLNAEVELIWPNNKKTKAASGTPMKDAAAKAGFKPNYGCEEGKCGSCELLANGKKLRPCTAKVPAAGPVTLKNP